MKIENLTSDELEVGKSYWLDDCRDESGVFVKNTDKAVYFEPNKDCVYKTLSIEEETEEGTAGLVGFEKPNEVLWHLKKY